MMIDIHSHILDNVDDGSKNIDESVNIIKNLVQKGITNIFLTPHYIIDSDYQLKNSIKKEKYENLVSILEKENIDVNLYLGNEVYIDSKVSSFIKEDNLTLNNTNYILLEFPLNGGFNNQYGIISGLIEKGYKVILAHPERYLNVQKDIKVLDEYKNIGVLFQANIGSLFKMYGKTAEKTVKKLLKKKYIDFLGTDIHNNHYNYSYLDKLDKKLNKLCDLTYIEKIKEKNAEEFLIKTT